MSDSDEIFATIKHYTGVDLPQDGRYRRRGDATSMLFAKIWERAVVIHGLQSAIHRDGAKTKTWLERVMRSLDADSNQQFPAVPTAHLEHLASDLVKFITEVTGLKVLMEAYVDLEKVDNRTDDLLA